MRVTTVTLTVILLLSALPIVAQTQGDELAGARWFAGTQTTSGLDWSNDSNLSGDSGVSRWFGAQEIGGSKTIKIEGEEEDGPSDTGRRLKAGGLSLLIPGMGQFYNGQKSKGLVMLGIEVVIWGAYIGFDNHAKSLEEDYQNWAGIYAGTTGSHNDSFWQSVGRYDDSDAWYDSQLREARAFQETEPAPPSDSEEWMWRNTGYRSSYQKLRADANTAYDNRDMMLLFAILNRAVSVFDAVKNGGEPAEDDAPVMGARVLGGTLALEVSPSLRRPSAAAVASWRF